MKFAIACLIGAAYSMKTLETPFGYETEDFHDHCAELEPYSQEQVDCYILEFCGDDCDFEDPCADLEGDEQEQCYDGLLESAYSSHSEIDYCSGLSGDELDECMSNFWEDPCAAISDEDEQLSCYESLMSDLDPCESGDDVCKAEFEAENPCAWSDDECWWD